jgi:hypothetical protein
MGYSTHILLYWTHEAVLFFKGLFGDSLPLVQAGYHCHAARETVQTGKLDRKKITALMRLAPMNFDCGRKYGYRKTGERDQMSAACPI